MVLNPANKFHLYNGSRPSEFNLKQYILQQSEQKAENENREGGDGSVTENISSGNPYAFIHIKGRYYQQRYLAIALVQIT